MLFVRLCYNIYLLILTTPFPLWFPNSVYLPEPANYSVQYCKPLGVRNIVLAKSCYELGKGSWFAEAFPVVGEYCWAN